METKASSKYIRISARKARLVVDTIRGKDLAAAQQILDFSDRAAARVVGKVLRAAAANAENNNGLTPDNLFVSRAYVDEGPTLKRFRPRAMGRATRINKRTCHITVVLDERELEKVAPKRGRLRKAVTGRGKAATARGKAEEKEKAEAAEEQEKPEEKAEAATAKPKAAKAAKPEAAKKEKPAEPKKKAEPASPKDKEKPPAKEKSED